MNTSRHAILAVFSLRLSARDKARWPCSLLLGLALLSVSGLQAQTPTPSAPPLAVNNSAITAPLFYQLLLGELNVRGGDPGAGYSLLLDAARKQKDPALYRRSVEVALQNRSGEAALTAARAWSTDLPQDPEADRFLLQILLALNRVGETTPVLRAIVERSAVAERNNTIGAIPQAYARIADKAAALAVVREALTDSLTQRDRAAAAWTTIGRMQLAAEQTKPALESVQKGHAADPASPFPALLALEMFERGQSEAEAVVKGHLNVSQPGTAAGAPSVSLIYAQILLALQRNAEARTLLTELTTRQPELADAWLAQGSLQVQSNALPAATLSLQKYMALAREANNERSERGLTQAYLLMAQIAEKQKDFPAANAWLDRIENTDDIMAAQMRRASLLASQGKLSEARALLRNHPERREGDARLKLVVEAELLREFKQYQASADVYGEAAQRFPEDTELIYSQAMMAEKADRLPEMERLLRQLIAAKPDHYHAYNALGYSLADRNIRLSEAKQLIEKAVELSPNNAFIQDSLAWVEYRMGNTARALDLLMAAYAKQPNAEIAAHLGEVLWVKGQREQALKIWREGLLLASDDEALLSTLKRFQVKP